MSVYERDGKYSSMQRKSCRDGVGALYERFEALKRELSEMGMFAPEYKRADPKICPHCGYCHSSHRERQSGILSILRADANPACS